MQYQIHGCNEVSGNLKIKVGKNFLLITIPGLLLLHGEIEIKNYIAYADLEGLLEILAFLGVKIIKKDDSVIIDTRDYQKKDITHPKAIIRSCFMVAGAMLTRDKTVHIPISYGWCTDMQSHKRACDFHLQCFSKMGAKIDIWTKENGDELVTIDGSSMMGTQYSFPKISVTGTVNTILAALGCSGTTILHNVALEPEVLYFINLFQNLGFSIVLNKENREIIVQGNPNFSPIQLKERLILELPSDRIVSSSFMILPLITSGDLTVTGKSIIANNKTLIEMLKSIGANINVIDEDTVRIIKKKDEILKPFNITADPFPGIATDTFPFLIILAVFCNGDSKLFDNIYNTRALSISNFLKQFNVDLELISGCDVIVHGNKNTIGSIENKDYQKWLNNIQNLRGQTAAFFFLIITQKEFIIDFNTFASQIVRGHPYPYIIEDLKSIGVKINPYVEESNH